MHKHWETAKKMIHANGSTLLAEMDYYTQRGVFYSGPDCFLMAEHRGDFWFIYCAVGEGCLVKFFELAPYPLEVVAWVRGNEKEAKFFKWDRVLRLCKKVEKKELT